jgi:hypothetical protein
VKKSKKEKKKPIDGDVKREEIKAPTGNVINYLIKQLRRIP